MLGAEAVTSATARTLYPRKVPPSSPPSARLGSSSGAGFSVAGKAPHDGTGPAAAVAWNRSRTSQKTASNNSKALAEQPTGRQAGKPARRPAGKAVSLICPADAGPAEPAANAHAPRTLHRPASAQAQVTALFAPVPRPAHAAADPPARSASRPSWARTRRPNRPRTPPRRPLLRPTRRRPSATTPTRPALQPPPPPASAHRRAPGAPDGTPSRHVSPPHPIPSPHPNPSVHPASQPAPPLMVIPGYRLTPHPRLPGPDRPQRADSD